MTQDINPRKCLIFIPRHLGMLHTYYLCIYIWSYKCKIEDDPSKPTYLTMRGN